MYFKIKRINPNSSLESLNAQLGDILKDIREINEDIDGEWI